MDLNDLKAEKAYLVRKVGALKALGDALTDDQVSDLEAKVGEITELNAQIEAAEGASQKRADLLAQIDGLTAPQPRRAATAGSDIAQVKERFIDDPKKGFRDINAFLGDVAKASTTGRMSAQLNYLAAAGSDEQNTQSDPFGGFLVPEGLDPRIRSVGVEADPTAGLVTNIPMGSPVLNINARVDKNHTSSVSGGLTVSRRAETQAGTSSRMSFEQIKLTANSLYGICYVTDEMLSDSPQSIAAIISAGFGDEFQSKILDEKIRGTGVGEMTGVLNSAALISVAKTGGQAADTITGDNIINMRKRAYRYGNTIWMVNHDCYGQLQKLHTTLTNDDVPLFVPGNGVDVPDTLLGRPVRYSEYASALGDKGDVILADWSQYLVGTYQGLQSAESMHVRFENHERAYKFWTRNDGAPWWNAALTPKLGANTLSPFVTLDARA